MFKKTLLSIGFILLVASLVLAQKGKKNTSQQKRSSNKELEIETALIAAEKELLLENYTGAYDLFLEAEELAPNSAVVQYKLAEVLLHSGEKDKAISYASQAKMLDPSNKYYYLLYAEILKSKGDLTKAAKVYEEMLNQLEGTDQYLYDLALIYQYQNKYDEALEAYERAEEVYGLSISVLEEKQKIYLKKGDLEGLIHAWDALISDNPDEQKYVLRLVDVLIVNERLNEAEIRLNKLRKSEESNAKVELLLSEIQRKKGNFDAAMGLLEEPLKSEEIDISEKLKLLGSYLNYLPNESIEAQLIDNTRLLADRFPEAFHAQAFAGDVLHQIGEKSDAVGYYRRAISLNPGHFSVWQNVINIELELNQIDSVVIHSERALEYFPNQGIFYFFNGIGYSIQNNYREAVQALERGKKFVSDQNLLGEFYGQLGDAYNGLKDFENSDKSYEEALTNNPNNDHVLNNYSYFLSLRKENLDKAVKMCEKLIKMHPNNPTYLDTYGWVLYVRGEFGQSRIYLEKAVKLDADKGDGTIIEHFGDVLFQLGSIDEAVAQWEKARSTSEASEFIEKKISDRKIYE